MAILNKKIIIIICSITLVPMLIIGMFLTVRMKNMAFDYSLSEANEVATRVVNRLDTILEQAISIGNTVISSKKINNIITIKRNNNLKTYESYLECTTINECENNSSYVSDVRIYVDNDTLLENLDYMRLSKDIKKTNWFEKTINADGNYTSGFYYDNITKKVYFRISRYYTPKKNMDAVLMLLINLESITEISGDETDTVIILDDNNIVLAGLENYFIGKQFFEWSKDPLTKEYNGLDKVVNGQEVHITYRDIITDNIENNLNVLILSDSSTMFKGSKEAIFYGIIVLVLSLIIVGAFSAIIVFLLAKRQEQEKHLYDEQMRFTVLKNQVNPHFLFNVFETIRMKAMLSGDKELSTIIRKFAGLIRRNLEISKEYIPLSNEIEFVRDYLYIQNYRFSDRFDFSFDVDDNTQNAMVFPLIIQPLVENAVIHSVENSADFVNISIKCKRLAENLIIIISDDGIGIEEDKRIELLERINAKDNHVNNEVYTNQKKKREKIGIRNIHQRIKLKFGEDYGISIPKSEKGMTVIITLPYILESSISGDIDE